MRDVVFLILFDDEVAEIMIGQRIGRDVDEQVYITFRDNFIQGCQLLECLTDNPLIDIFHQAEAFRSSKETACSDSRAIIVIEAQ